MNNLYSYQNFNNKLDSDKLDNFKKLSFHNDEKKNFINEIKNSNKSLYEKYKKYNNYKNDTYIILISDLANYFIDNGILYDDNDIVDEYINDLVKAKIDTRTHHYNICFIIGNMCGFRIEKKDLDFFKEFILPELIQNKLDMVVLESDIIYIETDLDSIYGDEIDKHVNLIKIKKYGQILLKDFIKETARLRSIGFCDKVCIGYCEKYGTNYQDKIIDILKNDRRVYIDIISIVKLYLSYKEINLTFYFE